MMNKTAIITGATSSIGFYIIKELIKLKYNLCLCGRDEDKLKNVVKTIIGDYNYHNIIYKSFDIQYDDKIKEFCNYSMSIYKNIDSIIFCHGIYDYGESSLDKTSQDFQYFLNVNCVSHFNFCNCILPNMIKNKNGNIISMNSLSGIRNIGFIGENSSTKNSGELYTASKHALTGYMKSLSASYASKGIRINMLALGSISANENSNKIKSIPVNRQGTFADVANCVKFLLSDESKYINGAIIPIDGGKLNT